MIIRYALYLIFISEQHFLILRFSKNHLKLVLNNEPCDFFWSYSLTPI